jgi:hypothetical protein
MPASKLLDGVVGSHLVLGRWLRLPLRRPSLECRERGGHARKCQATEPAPMIVTGVFILFPYEQTKERPLV